MSAPTNPPAPAEARRPFEILRDADKLTRIPLPTLAPPDDVTLVGVDPDSGFPVLQWGPEAVTWVGQVLAWADEKRAWMTEKRSAWKREIEAAADAGQKRIAEIDTRFRDAYAKPLLAWIDANRSKKKKSIDLEAVSVGYETKRAMPERIEGPPAEAALQRWVEENLGLDYIERKPRVKWAEVKERLKALGIEKGVGNTAVIYAHPETGEPLMDRETGESMPMTVPGVTMSAAGDVVWGSSTAGERKIRFEEDEESKG
jgi:hypothetical protein